MGINLVEDGHSVVSLGQLLNWSTCDSATFSANSYTAGQFTFHFDDQTPNAYYADIELDPCSYFGKGKVRSYFCLFLLFFLHVRAGSST